MIYTKSPREIVNEWIEEGRIHVSPAEAAKVLHVDPLSIRTAWLQRGSKAGYDGFMAGRNLRIMVASLSRLLDGAQCEVNWPALRGE